MDDADCDADRHLFYNFNRFTNKYVEDKFRHNLYSYVQAMSFCVFL